MTRTRLLLALTLAVTALGAAPAASAAQWEQLPVPTNLHALHVSDTEADLDWLSSSLGNGDVLQRKVNGRWKEWARDLHGFRELSGLTPGTTYTVRVYTLGNEGLWTLNSPPSPPFSFSTLPGPDAVPPQQPSPPTFTGTGTSSTTLFWPQTTDNVEVTGYYLDRLVDGTWTTLRTVGAFQNQQYVGGLSPATTVVFGVRAFDARGNVSARSAAAEVTTLAETAQPDCAVHLTTFWSGFLASLSVRNTTSAPITGWTITATLPASVAITSSFGGGSLSRDGDRLTISALSWNATLAPGGTLAPGFIGSSAQNLVPSGFAFNGIPCTVS